MVIPVRFVWPHGGRAVFISGSFTGWSNMLLMSAVEGCPTVFQAIYSLTPGYHQYKFCVDGEWRHDENQPYVPTNEYGIVNTMFLTVDVPPPMVGAPMPYGSSMEVDNDAFRRTVEVSDGMSHEVVPRMSEIDLEISRHRISQFLASNTAYELLPESGKVIAFDVELPVKQAFHVLYEQGISMAPLWDFRRGQFVGLLSAMDFVMILRELGSRGSNLTEEELETHTISAWKDGKAYLTRPVDGQGRPIQRQLIHAGPFDSLKDVATKILKYEVATVPILHSTNQDNTFPQLLHLASLSGILKCICRYFRSCAGSVPVLQLPLHAVPVGTWVPKIGVSNQRPLALLRPNASLNSALNLLIQAQVSSIPIVDDNDSLLDIYSRSDITALARDKAYAHINLDEMSVQQALQLGQDSFTPYELRSQRCQMCLRTDTLHKAMERLANPGVRRLIVVEAGSKRVEGIVSLSDIFKFLLVG
uniref:CBS domain-containing protein n=1 Tax=Kalanchoe fedtschenkoi TaxID=63787 RepID=A0A7N0UJ63_KALFE